MGRPSRATSHLWPWSSFKDEAGESVGHDPHTRRRLNPVTHSSTTTLAPYVSSPPNAPSSSSSAPTCDYPQPYRSDSMSRKHWQMDKSGKSSGMLNRGVGECPPALFSRPVCQPKSGFAHCRVSARPDARPGADCRVGSADCRVGSAHSALRV